MGWLLHLVQRGGVWAGCGPAQSPSRCTKCNSPPITRPVYQLYIIRCGTIITIAFCKNLYRVVISCWWFQSQTSPCRSFCDHITQTSSTPPRWNRFSSSQSSASSSIPCCCGSWRSWLIRVAVNTLTFEVHFTLLCCLRLHVGNCIDKLV